MDDILVGVVQFDLLLSVLPADKAGLLIAAILKFID
jgi:hypothetical protein